MAFSFRGRRRWRSSAVALVALTGCYLSHPLPPDEGAPVDDPPDAAATDGDPGVRRDGGPDACVGDGCGVVARLDGLRWELPCTGATERDDVCRTVAALDQATELEGPAGARYDVTVRFRGVVETKAYAGGEGDGLVRFGGTPSESAWNLYELRVGSPPRRVFLNAGPDREFFCVGLDATVTIPMDAGSTVRLRAEAYDDRQIVNVDRTGRRLVVAGIPPAPEPFDGQFIQMDVLDVRRR